MIKKLTMNSASIIGSAVREADLVSMEINQKIYEEARKFKFTLQTMIIISEVRQYLTMLENNIIEERQKLT